MSSEPQAASGILCNPHPDVQIRSLAVEDTVMTIHLAGQIRYQSVASLQEYIFDQFCTTLPQTLILDFQEVSFLDSQGLALLISLYKFCYPQGCGLAIRNAPGHVCNLIQLTRLNAFIKLI